MFISSNIKFLRNRIEKTQAQFGSLFGKSRSNIDSYERGKAKPDEDLQIKIANHFKISLETLLYKDIAANPAIMATGRTPESDALKAKEEIIKELRSQIKFLQTQNETLLDKIHK